MPLDGLHRRIAAIALRAAGRHGFALGGGNALIAHGVIDRLTQDVDLVTNRETGVKAATGPVERALRREGFTAQRQESDLADVFPDWDDGMTDWKVTAPGGRRTELQLAYFDRSRKPVTMDVGPVLHLEDAAGSKVCALASRVKLRDYIDTAALLGRWTPAELIGFACRLDPGLGGRDLAGAAMRLDRTPDEAFTPFGLPEHGAVVLLAVDADTACQALADAGAWHGVYGDCAVCVAVGTCADEERHAVIAVQYAALRARLGGDRR